MKEEKKKKHARTTHARTRAYIHINQLLTSPQPLPTTQSQAEEEGLDALPKGLLPSTVKALRVELKASGKSVNDFLDTDEGIGTAL